MKTLMIFTLAVFGLVCAGCNTTPSAAKKGSPAVYKIAFENDKLRVIEYHTE